MKWGVRWRTGQMTRLEYLKRYLRDHKNDDHCFIWPFAEQGRGYGGVAINGKKYSVHRAAYELTHKNFDRQLLVCHHCDTPRCFNPRHLFLGTHEDNIRDCANKSRMSIALTEEDARKILALKGTATLREAAAPFKIAHTTVRNIWTGKTWTHLQR